MQTAGKTLQRLGGIRAEFRWSRHFVPLCGLHRLYSPCFSTRQFTSSSSTHHGKGDKSRKGAKQNREPTEHLEEEEDDIDFSKPPDDLPLKQAHKKGENADSDAKSTGDNVLPNFENSEHPPELSLRAARRLFTKDVVRRDGYDSYGQSDHWDSDDALIRDIPKEKLDKKNADIGDYVGGDKHFEESAMDFRRWAAFRERINDPYAPFDPEHKSELTNWLDLEDEEARHETPGLKVNYCIFCYHGTHFLTAENTALLTQFVSAKGLVLPKRLTKCCAKHQRKLARKIKMSRHIGLLPWQNRLHPKLRFSSLKPSYDEDPRDILSSYGGPRDSHKTSTNSQLVDSALAELESMAEGNRK